MGNSDLFYRVDECDLTARAVNGLEAAGIFNIFDTEDLADYELHRIKNFGRKSIKEVRLVTIELRKAMEDEARTGFISVKDMTLRDFFAGMALCGGHECDAYEIADRMIEQRDGK